MTLFTLLLVLGWERLFKLGEHWQLEHRLRPIFRGQTHFSMIRTTGMAVLAMLITLVLVLSLRGYSSAYRRCCYGSWSGYYASAPGSRVCIIMLI